MAGWHSLSGYLQYKSGNNAFGRLMTKRKVWCILEESKCQLLLYKSEQDVHKQRQSSGHIDVQGAAISLDLEHQNQFVIISERKEHVFTAENHESMMIWLLGLQAKRDLHSKKLSSTQSGNEEEHSFSPTEQDYENLVNKPSLYMTYDQHHENLQYDRSCRSSISLTRKGFHWEKYGSRKTGESVDSGISAYKKRLEASRSFPLNNFAARDLVHSKHLAMSHSLQSIESDSDDVFGREIEFHRQKGRVLSQNWKKLQHAVLGHVIQSRRFPSAASSADRRSASSRSASSDSAIERGEGTPQELISRLGELERELISTKCELAKVMNRQTSYQELLLQKDDTIKYLEEQNTDTSKQDDKKNKSPSKLRKADKEFQEKIRVLQNQNRFLNEEVKKLAKLRLQEQGHYQEQNMKLQCLEAEIEKWKMDYVSLIQSSIRFPGDEGVEDVELCLYGGDKHKKRVQTLLQEARKINPRLPTYESLANNEVHVDAYGFKHVYTNTGLLLHYLCTELTYHYLVQAGVYEEHQKKWTMFMRQHGKDPMACLTELKPLCRGGIPDRFRKQMWRQLVQYRMKIMLKDKGDHYYRNLCNMLPESPLAACYRKQVSLDLMRTMPSNIKFSSPGSKGIMDLQDVLLAFCVHNPTIGYCQGMNFIVGMSLIFMDPEDAFWTLVALAESYFSPHYFDHSLIGAQSDQQVLKDMVKDKLPALFHHLEGIDIELSTITLNWFLAVFFDAVPFQTLLRIWDCFLLEGPKVLFRFSLAILKLHEKDILQKTDTMGIMKHLKACAKLTYDVEGLVKLAFEGLKPFPKRKDILSKQTCYLNTLKEKYKKKELQRLAFAEREQLYMNMETECGPFLGIECAVAASEGKVWFCYGDQHIGRLSYVSCELGTMCNTDFKLDSRLMCMYFMGQEELLLGTISWMLVSVDVNKHEQIWQIQLHDAILSVCCYDDEDIMATRIFSGLADGTIAVTEKPFSKTEPNVDVIYVAIGQAPVTCLMLLGDQVWCASGNTVAVIHAKTLDAMDTFSVSVNPYDHILSLIPSEYGIWISLRGSSILELWDPHTLNCRMLYDTRTDRYPQLRKEDDTYFNRARITSMLANGSKVWVGTGEGNLMVYEILESAQLKTPTELSPSVETSSSMSYIARPEKQKDIPSCELASKLRKVYHLHEINADSTEDCRQSVPGEHRVKLGSVKPKDGRTRVDSSVSSSGVNKRGNRLKVRRRSSSENDLDILYLTHYQEDTERLNAAHSRHCSENNLELLEKERHISSCDSDFMLDHVLEDEMEQELEANARRESVPMLVNGDIVEYVKHKILEKRLSEKRIGCNRQNSEKRAMEQNGGISDVALRQVTSDSSRSDETGCDSKTLSRKSRTSTSSAHSNTTKSGSCSSLTNKIAEPAEAVSEDDEYEAELEARARRESLVNTEIEQKALEILESKIVDEGPEIKDYRDKVHDGEIVKICLDAVVDHINEERMEKIARRNSLLGIDDDHFDDSYLSSSPSMSLTPCHSPYLEDNMDVSADLPAADHVNEEEIKEDKPRTTALGMSIDSTDDNATGENVLMESVEESPEPVENIEVVTAGEEMLGKRRRSSVLEDISILCSDCRIMKQKCSECAKLLKSQESLKINERRLSRTDSADSGLVGSFTSEKKSLTKNAGKLNGIRDMSQESSTGEWFCSNENKENASHKVLCNTDNAVESMQLRTDLKMEKNKQGSDTDLDEEQVNDDNENANNESRQVKVFPSGKSDKRDFTRQEKVGYWLHSLSQTKKMDNEGMRLESQSHDTSNINQERGKMNKENVASVRDGSRASFENYRKSSKGSVGDEEVFYSADESPKHVTGKTSPERPGTLNLLRQVTAGIRGSNKSQNARPCSRLESGGSDGSSGRTQKSTSEIHVSKHDSDTQYRLDFTSLHVDTDVESESNVPNIYVLGEDSLQKCARRGSGDSRKQSLDLGSIQENCSWLESECKQNENSENTNITTGQTERQKIFEFLKTPSLASRHASLGLKIIEDDLEWTDLFSGHCTTPSPTSTTDQRLADFLRTPSISSKPSSIWSSYENISTPSHVEDSKFLRPMPQHRGRLSHSPSTASMGSDNDLLYNVDLNLEAKMKISDKPVKCLLSTVCNQEPIILSFSGSFGDDEAVLKWKKLENEQLWTNEPVLELCPKTNTAILPSYMRRRMSSNTSSHCSGGSRNNIE
ncbi:uncharacterized protein LOC123534907 isoform X2 [Mercenaria mercenaria]|uniref:uncharacterized protein LOC123534907 isoform X2 n=1 Tax=Mercenaria mercenaria TaxID=6596 RepID=UPI00234F457E|nr:uncharacterized protein LOC123534907 isoform X2 [Mercenaria mercenaria]